MGGVKDFLFGSKPKVKAKKVDRLTPGQMELLDELTNLLKGQLGIGIEPYSGQLVPGASEIQQQLFEMLSPEGTVGGLTKQGAEYISQLMQQQFNPQEAQDYWQRAYVMPAQRAWEETVVPEVMERYAGANALDSGAARRALAKSWGDVQSQLNAELAKILWGEKQSLAQRQDIASRLGLSLLPEVMGMGEEQRAITQELMQEPYQKWQMSQPWANPWLNYLGTALGTTPYQINTYTTGGGSGLLGSLLPTAGRMGMAGLVGSFMPKVGFWKGALYGLNPLGGLKALFG